MLGLEALRRSTSSSRIWCGASIPSPASSSPPGCGDNRIPGWDVTACVPKGVTEALEGGDERIQPAIWRAWSGP